MEKQAPINGLLCVARNAMGETREFRLSEHEKQYTIGRNADISLEPLMPPADKTKRTKMYPVVGFLTFIDGGWYIRSAKGFRRGKRMLKVNGKVIDASHPELRLRNGHSISFGQDDAIVVQVYEKVEQETLKHRIPELGGLFDKLKMEFELLNGEIRTCFGLTPKAHADQIMKKLQENGLFDAAYEYNAAKGLRNLVAHPAPGLETGIKRQYVYDALNAVESVRQALLDFQDKK